MEKAIYMGKQDTSIVLSELWRLKASTHRLRSNEIQFNFLGLINVTVGLADIQIHEFCKTPGNV